jgi:hypothetical protein
MHTIKHPVTFGSRVPLWPVFSTLKGNELVYGAPEEGVTSRIPEDSFHPSDNLMAGWVRWFVKVDYTGADV